MKQDYIRENNIKSIPEESQTEYQSIAEFLELQARRYLVNGSDKQMEQLSAIV